jgi:DNA-binding NarL/FixJ family response regulator
VLIADDNGLFATALDGILRAEESIEIVGRAADGREAVRLTEELAPDVVLMDLSMPRLDGFEATRRIRSDTPGTAVVVLTGSLDDQGPDPAGPPPRDPFGRALATLGPCSTFSCRSFRCCSRRS